MASTRRVSSRCVPRALPLLTLAALAACTQAPAAPPYADGSGGATNQPAPSSSGTAGAPAPGGAPAGGSAGASGTSSSAAGSGGVNSSWSTVGPDRPPASNASWVYVDGYRLMVGLRQGDGTLATPTPFELKGVGWSPMPVGSTNTAGYTLHYTAYADQDVPLIAGLNANVVKTYNAFELNDSGRLLLDELYARGVMVIMTVMPSYWDAENKAYLQAVNTFKGHPAILMWLLGNELNYNKLYNGSLSLDQAIDYVRTAIDDIHAADGEHPVAVSWGNAPTANYISALQAADVWALNLYPFLSLSERFDEWLARSKKPIFVGEYGADAYNAMLGAEDQDKQAEATQVLTEQIIENYSAVTPSKAVLGGCIFELADEWWKAKGTSPSSHDAGGFSNSGVYPDGIANEEWWGLVSVERQPRKAYDTLKSLYAP